MASRKRSTVIAQGAFSFVDSGGRAYHSPFLRRKWGDFDRTGEPRILTATETSQAPAMTRTASVPAGPEAVPPPRPPFGGRSIVLVGLMGAGKTTVGRRLAARLGIPFVDADSEVEAAAGLPIPEIFATHGEAAFRDGERRVIARLLHGGPQVLATGGGAFVDADTRARVAARGISVWLSADLDTLMRRVGRRPTRPLLRQGDPRATMERLMRERAPFYARADIALTTGEGPHDEVVDRLAALLEPYR